MSSASFYKWRAKYGGMDASLMGRMKEFEAENNRLKKMYADVQLQNDVIKEALAKKWWSRPVIVIWQQFAVNTGRLNIRSSCAAFTISESCYRYQPKLSDENAEIADWLILLTDRHRNWGGKLCFLYLRHVRNFGWNHKRVYRIYCELALNQIIEWRGAPCTIRCDNGPEYVSELLATWAEKRGIGLQFVQPGKPQQNAYVERYNKTVSYDWLNQHIFETIEEVQEAAKSWLRTYNIAFRVFISTYISAHLGFAEFAKIGADFTIFNPNPKLPGSSKIQYT